MSAVNIHATCVRLGQAGRSFGAPSSAGILLLGPSGSGKSDLALRLIERGAVLVADDRTDLFVQRGRLHARSPGRIAGLIEVHGLGIVDLPFAEKVRIALAVDLGKRGVRMPVHSVYEPPKALKLTAAARPPRILLDPFEPSAPVKIAVAAAAFASRRFREDVKPD
jgi:HPr kinase/phosphorylase